MVLDSGASLLSEVKNPYLFMMACLCHDFGKITATGIYDGVIKSINHENTGDELIKNFLNRITNEKKVFKYVLNMTHNHMMPNKYARDNASIKATNKMFDDSICPSDLIILSHADNLGKVSDLGFVDHRPFLEERLALYNELMARPYVMGADLEEAGLRPHKLYKEALVFAHKLRLAGVCKDKALPQVVAYFNELKKQKYSN